MPLRAIACTRSSRGTSSGMMALQAGAVSAEPMPMANVSASSTPAVTACPSVSAARVAAARMVQTWVAIRKTRRSTMSASAPPGRASRNTGMMVAACTMATISGRGASTVISQPAPVFCNQVPSQATTLAIHSMRKVRLRSGTRAGGRRIIGFGEGSWRGSRAWHRIGAFRWQHSTDDAAASLHHVRSRRGCTHGGGGIGRAHVMQERIVRARVRHGTSSTRCRGASPRGASPGEHRPGEHRPGSIAQGSIAQRSIAQGSIARGSIARGSIARGSIARGSIAQGEPR